MNQSLQKKKNRIPKNEEESMMYFYEPVSSKQKILNKWLHKNKNRR